MTRRGSLPLALVGACLAGCLGPLESHAYPPYPQGNTSVVVPGNTQFAFELHGQLRSQKGNLFFSPFSISTALAMTSAGARGQTLDQMTRTLHLPEQKQLHPALGQLLRQLAADKKRGYELSTGSALWGQKGKVFLRDYLNLVDANYQAGLQTVDFVGNTESARQTINGWVEKQTKNKIKDLMKPGTLDRNTRLVLTNAIYFKGDWASQFKKDQTRPADFFLADGKTVKTPMMSQEGQFRHAHARGMQILEMPYVGNELSMVILLPARGRDISYVERQLTPEKMKGWLKGLRSQKVQVSLPRFKMTCEFSLKRELAALGLELAFTPKANFSGMDGKRELYLSDMVHKAFVDVNEKGTEAAAATGVIVRTLSIERITEFRADRPFVFLIRDRKSGSVLFLGRVMNPV